MKMCIKTTGSKIWEKLVFILTARTYYGHGLFFMHNITVVCILCIYFFHCTIGIASPSTKKNKMHENSYIYIIRLISYFENEMPLTLDTLSSVGIGLQKTEENDKREIYSGTDIQLYNSITIDSAEFRVSKREKGTFLILTIQSLDISLDDIINNLGGFNFEYVTQPFGAERVVYVKKVGEFSITFSYSLHDNNNKVIRMITFDSYKK